MTTAINLTKYNAACSRVRKLLDKWLESGLELFLELRRIESEGEWQAPGHATFSDFLRAEFPNALGIDRYQNVMRAIDVHGVEFVRKIGVHSAHAASVTAVAEHPNRVKLLQASVNKFIEDKRVPPEVDEVRRMVRDISALDGDPPRPRGTVRALLAEQELRKTVARLKDELQKARERIRELEGALASGGTTKGSKRVPGKGGSRKPRRK